MAEVFTASQSCDGKVHTPSKTGMGKSQRRPPFLIFSFTFLSFSLLVSVLCFLLMGGLFAVGYEYCIGHQDDLTGPLSCGRGEKVVILCIGSSFASSLELPGA